MTTNSEFLHIILSQDPFYFSGSDSISNHTGLGAMIGGGLGVLVAVMCLILAIKIRKNTSETGDMNPSSSSTTSSLGPAGRSASVVETTEGHDFTLDRRQHIDVPPRRSCKTDPVIIDGETLLLVTRSDGEHDQTRSLMYTVNPSLNRSTIRQDKNLSLETILNETNDMEEINEVVNINEEDGPDLIIDSLHFNNQVTY